MIAFALGMACLAALASVVLGRNLTRATVAALVSISAFALALAVAGGDFATTMALVVAALVLGVIQLFGWMLVDVDRDHLPPTDGATRLARSLAFLLLGVALVLLAWALLGQGGGAASSPEVALGTVPAHDAVLMGSALFEEQRELVYLCGLVLAAGLLAMLMTLRDDGEAR